MELTVIRTLRDVHYLDDALTVSPIPIRRLTAAPPIEPKLTGPTARFIWGRFACPARGAGRLPPQASPASLLTEGVVLFLTTPGIPQSMADPLADLGQRTVFLGPPDASASSRTPAASTPTDHPEAVADVLSRVREETGPVSGLIHLAPLAEA
jgi:hypothetical protein